MSSPAIGLFARASTPAGDPLKGGSTFIVDEPVSGTLSKKPPKPLVAGTALCLSGGGYRAMVFHIGAIWRLYEAGILRSVKRISSVSGGSVTAAVLGLKWAKLSFDPGAIADDFIPEFVTPLRALAAKTVDVGAVVGGLLLPGRISERLAAAYDRAVFGGATLQDLPDEPRFVINASNVQSGALWRFMKPYMRDWRVGEVKSPKVRLADAVAASSAFPPFLSPFALKLDPDAFTSGSGEGLQRPPFTSRVILTDGGVYDNLGLETAWKRFDTILVSDAGGKLAPQEAPRSDWPRHFYRVIMMIDDQVRSLRTRQVIDSFDAKARKGTYWATRSDISHYGLADPLPCPVDRTLALAHTPTRLARLDPLLQERLINWGYAICDTALHRHVDPGLPRPADFPYPSAGV
jgi:NTE family protein